jgi:hypothetical protein
MRGCDRSADSKHVGQRSVVGQFHEKEEIEEVRHYLFRQLGCIVGHHEIQIIEEDQKRRKPF